MTTKQIAHRIKLSCVATAIVFAISGCSKTEPGAPESASTNPFVVGTVPEPTSDTQKTSTDSSARIEAPAAKPKSIDFSLSVDMDARTINKETVVVTRTDEGANTASPIDGTVEYDPAQKKIVFQPARDLLPEANYRLSLVGLRQLAGEAVPNIELPFTPNHVADDRFVRFKEGKIASYIKTTSEPDTGSIRLSFYLAGSDGEWFSPDDVLARSITTTFNAQGKLTGYVDTLAPGADGQWFTADDKMNYVYSAVYDTSGKILSAASHGAAGPDGKWLTADDIIRYYETYTYVTANSVAGLNP